MYILMIQHSKLTSPNNAHLRYHRLKFYINKPTYRNIAVQEKPEVKVKVKVKVKIQTPNTKHQT